MSTDLGAIRDRYHNGNVSHICDQANKDIGKLLRMIYAGPPPPPKAVLHDIATALDVARVCILNDERGLGLAEMKRASGLLRELAER